MTIEHIIYETDNYIVDAPERPLVDRLEGGHIRIFGRAKTATKQKYGEAVQLPKKHTGFYEGFKPLDEEDIKAIYEEIEKLLQTDKYQNF